MMMVAILVLLFSYDDGDDDSGVDG